MLVGCLTAIISFFVTFSVIASDQSSAPSPSDPQGFCRTVIAEFGRLRAESHPQLAQALMAFNAKLESRSRGSESLLEGLDSLTLEAINELLRDIESGELNLKQAIHVGFRDFGLHLHRLIRAQEYEKQKLLKAGVRAHSLIALETRIQQLRSLDERIRKLSPQELTQIFLEGLGLRSLIPADKATSQQATQDERLQKWKQDEGQYHIVVKKMVDALSQKLSNRAFSKNRSMVVLLMKERFLKEGLSAKPEDILIIGDLFREDLLSIRWGGPQQDFHRAAREALTRFLTTAESLELDQSGHLPSVSEKQLRFHEFVVKRATNPDFLTLDRLYFGASLEFKEWVQKLRMALLTQYSRAALPLDPRPKDGGLYLADSAEIATALVQTHRVAQAGLSGRGDAVKVLTSWLFEGYGSQLSKTDRARLEDRISASLPLAYRVAGQVARARFYRGVGKGLGYLLLGAVVVSGGLEASYRMGLAPSSVSWDSQWDLFTQYFFSSLKWMDLQLEDAENLFIKTADTFGKNP